MVSLIHRLQKILFGASTEKTAAVTGGAEKIRVPHESLQPGDACPDCTQGTVYEVSRPGVLVRIIGQPAPPTLVCVAARATIVWPSRIAPSCQPPEPSGSRVRHVQPHDHFSLSLNGDGDEILCQYRWDRRSVEVAPQACQVYGFGDNGT